MAHKSNCVADPSARRLYSCLVRCRLVWIADERADMPISTRPTGAHRDAFANGSCGKSSRSSARDFIPLA